MCGEICLFFLSVLDMTNADGGVILAFLVLLAFNVGFAVIAALLIAYKVWLL
jgi:hypothetical protein